MSSAISAGVSAGLSMTGTMPARAAPMAADSSSAQAGTARTIRSPARSPAARRDPATRRCWASEVPASSRWVETSVKRWGSPGEDLGHVAVQRRVDRLQLGHTLGERHPDDAAGVEGDHGAELAVVNGVDGRHPEPGSQHPVEGGRCPSTLHVPEDGHPRLEPGALLDLDRQLVADAAEALVAELVDLTGRDSDGALLGPGSFGDHHDRRVTALGVTGLQLAADLVHVEGLLGHDDLGGSAGDAGVGGDPAVVAAHHLTDDHPI